MWTAHGPCQECIDLYKKGTIPQWTNWARSISLSLGLDSMGNTFLHEFMDSSKVEGNKPGLGCQPWVERNQGWRGRSNQSRGWARQQIMAMACWRERISSCDCGWGQRFASGDYHLIAASHDDHPKLKSKGHTALFPLLLPFLSMLDFLVDSYIVVWILVRLLLSERVTKVQVEWAPRHGSSTYLRQKAWTKQGWFWVAGMQMSQPWSQAWILFVSMNHWWQHFTVEMYHWSSSWRKESQ